MFGNLSKPMLKSAARRDTRWVCGWSREQARALALEAGFAEPGGCSAHADESGMRRASRSGCGRAAREQCATWSGRNWRRGRGGAAAAVRAGIPFPVGASVLVCLVNYNSQQPRSTEMADEGSGVDCALRMDGRMETGKVEANGTRRPTD